MRLSALLEQARLVVQDCYLVHAGALSGFSTASTVADVEQARRAWRRPPVGRIGDGARHSPCGPAPTRTPSPAVLDGHRDPTLNEPDASEHGPPRREHVRRLRRRLCGRARLPARRRPPRRRSPSSSGCAQPLASATAEADRGHDRHRNPDRARQSRRLARPGHGAGRREGGEPTALINRWPLLSDGGGLDVALRRAATTQRRLTPDEVAELTERWRELYPLVRSHHRATIAVRVADRGARRPAGPGHRAAPDAAHRHRARPARPARGYPPAAGTTPQALFLSCKAAAGAFPRTPCVTGAVTAMLVDGTPVDGTLCPP